ncbi:MAG: hypothetical protein KC983_11050 [Phycisphaerales bacterium]|nr:hypothetical protein [Phycisphaerales bacterium]
MEDQFTIPPACCAMPGRPRHVEYMMRARPDALHHTQPPSGFKPDCDTYCADRERILIAPPCPDTFGAPAHDSPAARSSDTPLYAVTPLGVWRATPTDQPRIVYDVHVPYATVSNLGSLVDVMS